MALSVQFPAEVAGIPKEQGNHLRPGIMIEYRAIIIMNHLCFIICDLNSEIAWITPIFDNKMSLVWSSDGNVKFSNLILEKRVKERGPFTRWKCNVDTEVPSSVLRFHSDQPRDRKERRGTNGSGETADCNN